MPVSYLAEQEKRETDIIYVHGLSVFFSLVKEAFTNGITDISPLLLSQGDLSSVVAVALSGSVWTGCPGSAHDHQPQSPSAAAPAVSLPGQTSRCRRPPHRPLCHLWFYCQRQLPLQWTCWPLCTSRGLPTQPAEDQQRGEWYSTKEKLFCCENSLRYCVTLKICRWLRFYLFMGWDWE